MLILLKQSIFEQIVLKNWNYQAILSNIIISNKKHNKLIVYHKKIQKRHNLDNFTNSLKENIGRIKFGEKILISGENT